MANTNTSQCTAVNQYDSLIHCPGKPVLPGLRKKGYAVSKNSIAKYASLPEITSSLDMEKASVLVGDFELFSDETAFRIDLVDTASSLASASQGEFPSKTFLNTLTIKYAGNNEAAAGFARMANSDDLVFFVQQRDGKWRVVGNEMFDTNVNPSQDSGMSVTDASGTTLEVTVSDICPAPFYEGLLHTADGWLNCKTGALTEEKPTAA